MAWGLVGLRLIIAGLAAATLVVSVAISAQAELGALVVIIVGGLVAESRAYSRDR